MTNEVFNFEELSVDKEDQIVKYNDELHKYWVKDTNKQCVSVTTLIHQFSTFDEAFWAAYKTLEALTSEEQFKNMKPLLLERKVFLNVYYQSLGISDEQFDAERNKILKEWERKREESCVRGTKIHRDHELAHLAGNTKELKDLGLSNYEFKTDLTNTVKFGDRGVYPELLMSRVSDDGELRIAGQADLVIIDGEDVYVCDYKTNKKIDQKSYFDSKKRKSSRLKYPLNNIDDSNFWHYSLQLSTYAWMIQKIDPRFNIKQLILIHYDHNGGCTTYECDYLKKDVERMLAYHKKQIAHDKFNKSREKVIF